MQNNYIANSIHEILKLSTAISQYFHNNNELHLTGIGSFYKEPGVVQEETKHGKNIYTGHISYEPNTHVPQDEGLVAYISQQTGKMNSLAQSDLQSYLELAIQFLNIGKPFVIEEVGTLVKNNEGNLRFIPYNEQERFKDPAAVEAITTKDSEEAFGPYNDPSKNKGSNWQKPLAFLLVLGGIVLAVWGGYYLYRSSINKEAAVTSMPTDIVPVEDSLRTDTITNQLDTTSVPSADGFKFILENTNKERAFTRYQQLLSYRWDVQLETKDSLQYKIYIRLPVQASDTSRIKDSLTLLTGRRVTIEN